MFGCGIGGLSRKWRMRRNRTQSKACFDAFSTHKLEYESSSGSDLEDDENEHISWIPTVQEPIKRVFKTGYLIEDSSPPMPVNPNDICFGNTLGRGASGTVYRGRLGCEDVAIKIIRPQQSALEMGTEPLEMYMGQSTNHPNIVKVLGVHVGNNHDLLTSNQLIDRNDDVTIFESPTCGRRTSSSLFSDIAQEMIDSPEEIWIVMEYCNRGSLREAIEKGAFFEDDQRQRPRILHILFAALEIAAALEHLHSCGIIHGDLKSQNVMLASSQILAKNFVCKVGDFGMSRPVTQIKTHISTFTAGTVSHMPPEVLKDGILTTSVDVFSFGILLWELISGKLPFSGLNSGETLISIVEGHRPEIPSYCPSMFAELIRSCWSERRDQRPTFKDIIRILKTMLGAPPVAANKGIPVMNAAIESSEPSCSTELFYSGETGTTSCVTTTDLSDNCCGISVQDRFLSVPAEGHNVRQPESEIQTSTTTIARDKTSSPSIVNDSLIPKPPRVSAMYRVTDARNAWRHDRTEKRKKPFPQWQAYLDAINASNNPLSCPIKTKIPSSSSFLPSSESAHSIKR